MLSQRGREDRERGREGLGAMAASRKSRAGLGVGRERSILQDTVGGGGGEGKEECRWTAGVGTAVQRKQRQHLSLWLS